ncbi:MAG: hypothetical protein KBT03_04210 [Bacteroidales bacterium]|nr:hypothetical protein [Candidatus Scybalousia scybalohippi]
MKFRTIIFTLIAVLLSLTLVSILIPAEGFDVFGIHFSFPSIKETLFPTPTKYANIDDLVADEHGGDTKHEYEIAKVKIGDRYISGLEYPKEDTTLLDSFFSSLQKASKTKVRILHYGDSQIEGDRITSYIRSRLQGEFSGKGQGQMPLYSLSNIKGVTYRHSSNWFHKSIINKRDKRYNRYGIMMTACIPYVGTHVDTLTMDTTYITSAWIEMDFAKPVANQLHLYCSNPDKNSTITITSNSETLVSKSLPITSEIIDIPISSSNPIKKLRIIATGAVQLYSVDDSQDKGVYVDNISLRGSSGWGINWNDTQFISDFADLIDVDLIIMQFGVNAIPQEEDKVLKSYDFFRKEYSRQLAFLKKAVPNAQIIVIGSSDRSRRKGNGYETNPNVPKLIQAQRQAAQENNCIFWDLFAAMGGENSMPSWVLREKPLANTDFIHFNAEGAKYVAEMFYQSFNIEYQKYLSRQKK